MRQLGVLGIGVSIKAVSQSSLVQNYLLNHHYQMAMVVFDVGPDPDLYSLWHSGADLGSLNFAYSRGWGLIDPAIFRPREVFDLLLNLVSSKSLPPSGENPYGLN